MPGQPTAPLTIEERVKRFDASRRTPALCRRLRHAVNREFGRAYEARDSARLERLGELTRGFAITYEKR